MSTAVPLEVQCTHRAPLREESRRRMKIVLAITAAVMVAEAVGGWLAHSLALLADAGHMLADVAALGLSLVVTALAQRPVTAERTFGLLRLAAGEGEHGRTARGGARAHRPLGRPRPDRVHPRRGVGARPPRVDRHERGDRDERPPGRPKPDRQPARARSRPGTPGGHGHPACDGADGAGSDLRVGDPGACLFETTFLYCAPHSLRPSYRHRQDLAPCRSATSPSSRMWTMGKPRWWTRCSARRGCSAPTSR